MQVALLVRVSSNSDRQDYNRQINDLTQLCDQRGWGILETIKGKFSATKTPLPQRKDLQRLFALASAGTIQKVLVTEISRLGRKAKDTRYIIDQLTSYQVSVVIQNRNIETISDDPNTQFVVNIILSIITEYAELEARLLSERIKSGIKTAKKKGKKVGRPKGETDFEQEIRMNPQYKKAVRALRSGTSVRKTASFAGISASTVQKIKRIINQA